MKALPWSILQPLSCITAGVQCAGEVFSDVAQVPKAAHPPHFKTPDKHYHHDSYKAVEKIHRT